MRLSFAVLVTAVTAVCGAASAQTVGESDARKLLFPVKGISVQILDHSFLSEKDKDLLREVAKTQNYYAVVAVPPAEGLFSEAAFAAANFHSIPAAEKVAIQNCESKRKGGEKCVVALRVFPKGWSDQPLQLSRDATLGFDKEYKKGNGPKAFAISPSTGSWSVFKGDGADNFAIGRCNDKARSSGSKDCIVVIKD
ncbi:MAG: 5-aminolevulic acid synthase [Pseudoruegeria sp.]